MTKLVNRAKMTTATTGTGTITLGSAESGYQSFTAAGVVDGDVVRYVIEDGTAFEIGTGTFTASGTTLTRTVSESSNADAALNLTGSAVVYVSATAADIPPALELYAENPSSPTAPSATGSNAVAIGSESVSSGLFSVSLGSFTDSTATNSVALGASSQALGVKSVAILGNATARESTAIGVNNLGSFATAAGEGAMALGGSYASGADSFAAAIANNTSSYGATGANSVAIGRLAKASSSDTFAVGLISQATGINSIAIGNSALATTNAIALRGDATAAAAVAIGMGSVASGGESICISNGSTNAGTASGTRSILVGNKNTSSGDYSVAIGFGATASTFGKYCFASGWLGAQGDAQTGTFVLRSDTTDATPEALTTNNSTAGITNQIILPNNSAYAFHGTIVARQQASQGTACAAFKIEGLIRREGNAASTVLVNSATTVLDNTPAWGMALGADTTNGGLKIEVTGAAATNIRFVATIHTSECTY